MCNQEMCCLVGIMLFVGHGARWNRGMYVGLQRYVNVCSRGCGACRVLLACFSVSWRVLMWFSQDEGRRMKNKAINASVANGGKVRETTKRRKG